ncbi:MAG: response regulator transcription factor [Bacillota bacterium]
MKHIIYAVEDEESIRDLYTYALTEHEVHAYETANDMYTDLKRTLPDLFLLDIMLPDISGHDILAHLRADKRTKDIPVIMVSAKDDEITKVRLLNAGADDYISKPFGVLELNARIKANLRKNPVKSNTLGDVIVNETEHSITIAGAKIAVTLKEYKIIQLLINNLNKTLTRENLLNDVWGMDYVGETRTIDMHIKMVRDKLAPSMLQIDTVRGVGYILKLKEEA